MSNENTYQGQCFCGAVEFAVSGSPQVMGYCHCESCRHWSASPVNAFSLWPQDALQIIRGGEHIGSYAKTPQTHRKWCTQCGGHLYSDHPTMGMVDIFAAELPDLVHEPSLHVHYQETVLPIRDGLPKMKDMPAEMGGSGELLPE